MIVVVGGIKGGSGKTTISTNLTALRSKEGRRVLLVDADEQKSASTWSFVREKAQIETPWSTIQLQGVSVRSEILKMQSKFDDIIVDVGGRDTTSQRSALTIADIFIVPFKPRGLDIWTLGSVKNLINDACALNTKLKSVAVVNQADSQGNENEEALDIIKECPEIMCFPHTIGYRKSFGTAASEGRAVNELYKEDTKAINEMAILYKLIFERLA